MSDFTVAVEHDLKNMRFVAVVDGAECELLYRRQGPQVVMTHTGVPPRLRGHGIAAALVQRALAWAEADGLQVVPACSYVQSYLRRRARPGAAA